METASSGGGPSGGGGGDKIRLGTEGSGELGSLPATMPRSVVEGSCIPCVMSKTRNMALNNK